jgi:L-ascorbate metabolism protein UlaG (beta-lactamase superfamily)
MSIRSSRKKGNKFVNQVPTGEVTWRDVLPMMREYAANKAEVVPLKKLGPFKTDAGIYHTLPQGGLRITWIGHSSLLIEIGGKRLLTDPMWSDRASFLSFMGPKRFFKPPIELKDLPPIDAVILSHDHYDHLDKKTIRHFAGTSIPFYCPLGLKPILSEWGIVPNYISEMDWGDSVMIGDVILTATPSRHFSGRGVTHRNETLWASFVIKSPRHNVFFGADSGWFPGFKEIGEDLGPFDLTILEIGAYGKHWLDIHMGPDHATNAHLALKGKLMMPIHWGTFNLALHAWDEPIEKLMRLAAEKNIQLFIPEPGLPAEVTGPFNSGWWKRFQSI